MATPNPLAATVCYLREAAAQLENAARRLEARDAWHLDHAKGLIDLGTKGAELARRQIEREHERRHVAILERAQAQLAVKKAEGR